ncbi:MAG: molybdopterin molybdenumtransferase MoeA [Phototrophicales bacterium]|nr:MAG: molybdopterin molybdenumtransferase MoeA [Phototrophicales bacterium]
MTATPEFFNVQPIDAALELLDAHWTPRIKTESLDPRRALGRVLFATVQSPINLPQFRRSTVDGYAVRSQDTFGASQSLPIYLTLTGRVPMGYAADIDIQQGEAVEIHTGGMLPDSADAVVMIERTHLLDNSELEVLAPVASGENVIQIGEDVEQGNIVLAAGRKLRPQDIGGLLAVGVTEIDVAVPPRIGILSCGDELVPPEGNVVPGQIRDINAHTLATLVEHVGGQPVLLGIARDTFDEYRAKAWAGFADVDVLVMTAGSSVSTRDYTRDVINSLGQPGVLQHGLAVKPGKPTIIGVCENKPVIGLPGNPVSALLVAHQIVVPIVKRLLGEMPRPTSRIQARLTHNMSSATGRDDTIPVRLSQQDGEWLAEPIFGKSNLIFTLIQADGFVQVPLNINGLRVGTIVDVMLFS